MSPNFLPWVIYAVACALELFVMSVRLSRRQRLWIGSTLLLLLAVSQGALLIGEPVIFGILFFTIGLYRLLNCMRFIYGRMHEEYLYRVVPRSSLVIGSAQTAVGLFTLVLARHHPAATVTVLLIAIFQLLAALMLVMSLRVNIKKSEFTTPDPLPDSKLPSVSVLIPARNETEDLEGCLKSIAASTYQKLEILVLDDLSHDRTPEIIKGFAHDGVRFIRGNEPGEVWLPKNAAYDKLAREASGEFLLFCGVDVRVGPDDIRNLVSFALQEKLTMVSVLPKRVDAAPKNSIAQQIRYIWELALPRFLAHRPPVLSTIWLIQTTVLKKYGGMSAVRRTVVPEGFFARELDKTNMYRFLRAGDAMLTSSLKSPSEQLETALRVRYPQLHRRPEVVMGVTLFELIAFIGVYAVVAYAAVYGHPALLAVALITVVFHLVLFTQLATVMGGASLRLFLQNLAAVFVDILFMSRSMYLYEFNEVRWKERNISLPVMHAIPSMPQLPKN